MHDCHDLIDIFKQCFFDEYNTLLVKGTDEPLYLPVDNEREHNMLIFAHGFFASALHETAHWLIAGSNRRKQVDFGYWYIPDGRTAPEQKLFQSVEIKPQAMEWILSQAAGSHFRVSIDNLNGSESETLAFKIAVYEQVKKYCEEGLSARSDRFRRALCCFYHTSVELKLEDFNLDSLN